MIIVSITGAEIARIFGDDQYLRCIKLRYEQEVIHGNILQPTANDGHLLMWIVAPSAHGLTAKDFHQILTFITRLFPNKNVIWAYEEVDDKRQTEIILLTTP